MSHTTFDATDTVKVEFWYTSGKYFSQNVTARIARTTAKAATTRKTTAKVVVHGINSEGYFNYHQWTPSTGWTLERSNKWD